MEEVKSIIHAEPMWDEVFGEEPEIREERRGGGERCGRTCSPLLPCPRVALLSLRLRAANSEKAKHKNENLLVH